MQRQVRNNHPIVGVIDLRRDPNKYPEKDQRTRKSDQDRLVSQQAIGGEQEKDREHGADADKAHTLPLRKVEEGILLIHSSRTPEMTVAAKKTAVAGGSMIFAKVRPLVQRGYRENHSELFAVDIEFIVLIGIDACRNLKGCCALLNRQFIVDL